MRSISSVLASGTLLLAAVGVVSPTQAQVPLPDVGFECVLLSAGLNGEVGVQQGIPYSESVKQTYTVTVPYSEEVVLPNGQTKTVTKTREEARVRTVMVTKMRTEEQAYDSSDCRLVLTNGRRGRLSSSSGWTPAVLVRVQDLKKPKLPRFFQKIFKPDTMICLLREGALSTADTDLYAPEAASSVASTTAGASGGYGQTAQSSQMASQVNFTVENRSGRAIKVHYEREDGSDKEVVLRRLGAGQSTKGFITKPGIRWVATINDRMVSEYWCPECAAGNAELTWTVGPQMAFNSWRGDDGTRFAWKDSETWIQYRPGGAFGAELEWVESTDEWIALYDPAADYYIRLYEAEAMVTTPTGWETRMMREGKTLSGQTANPNVTVSVPGSQPIGSLQAGSGSTKVPRDTGSDLTQAEAQAMLDVHNAARRQVGAPPLKWSKDLARYAQSWADLLASTNGFEHRQNSPYGENLAQADSSRQAAQLWLSEKSLYRGQRINGSNYLTFGHYTQMIWKSTTEFGCGKARTGRTTTWVANYNPVGNMQGERP